MKMTLNQYSNKKDNKPIDKLNIMGVNVAVWEHEKDEKKFKQITLKKSYKDSEGNYKDTDSFSIFDIPNIIVALDNIYKKQVLGKYK